MRAIGAESRWHLQKIYTISAAIAGIAGALLTQTTETVSLGVLEFQRSADILVILILGGAGRLYGGLIGAIIFLVARDQFSGINPQYWYFPIGILLIAVVLLLPIIQYAWTFFYLRLVETERPIEVVEGEPSDGQGSEGEDWQPRLRLVDAESEGDHEGG